MFLAGMFAISGAFVSCDDSDDTDGVNKLEVTPSTDISFKADGNEDVVLTVVTDADKWSVEKTDWITVKQNGNKLTVNAEANTTESERPGRSRFRQETPSLSRSTCSRKRSKSVKPF